MAYQKQGVYIHATLFAVFKTALDFRTFMVTLLCVDAVCSQPNGAK